MGGDDTIQLRENSSNPTLLFFSTWFCPYAQRAWIALEFKGVNYQFINCQLYDGSSSTKKALSLAEKQARTPGFVECSPRGLVPGLKHGDANIYESIPAIEYIEEAFAGASLLPVDPAERAKIRIGLSLWNEMVIKRFYSVLLTPREEWDKEKSALMKAFEDMMPLFSDSTPFFSAHGFSLFECACLPWFQRTYSVLRTYRDIVLEGSKFKRLHDWYSACLEIPAFANTLVQEQILIENYIGYANNTASNNCSSLNRPTGTK